MHAHSTYIPKSCRLRHTRPYSSRDAGRSKLLSRGARCDHLKTSISIYQKKAFGGLYRALPLCSCAFNVCGSYAHFNVFPYKFQLNENAKALCLYCTDSKGINICVKAIQWDKLWYDFPVFTVSDYREKAVSFKKVDLPESLTLAWSSSQTGCAASAA